MATQHGEHGRGAGNGAGPRRAARHPGHGRQQAAEAVPGAGQGGGGRRVGAWGRAGSARPAGARVLAQPPALPPHPTPPHPGPPSRIAPPRYGFAIFSFCTSVDNTKVTLYHLISQAGWHRCHLSI